MTGERGTAVVEALLVGLLLLVPAVWLLAVLSEVHAAAMGTTAAARAAGFEAARAASPTEAARAVNAAVAAAVADHGLDPHSVAVRWSGGGLGRGALVEVEVAYPVPVSSFPLLGRSELLAVTVRARHVARVEPYASRP